MITWRKILSWSPLSFTVQKIFKVLKKTQLDGNNGEISKSSGGYCCGYTIWVYTRQGQIPASPGGPQRWYRPIVPGGPVAVSKISRPMAETAMEGDLLWRRRRNLPEVVP